MKNIITSCSLKQFEEHIETGILMLQDQLNVPINYYTFGFFVQELNRYIAELEHPRYLAYITGGITNSEKMLFTVHIGDRFNQDEWIKTIGFAYPKGGDVVKVNPSITKDAVGGSSVQPPKPTIVPVPQVEVFESAIVTGSKAKGYTKTMGNRRKSIRCKFTNYTEYVNYVSVIFDELAGCTDCLNKTLIDAFLGRFSYPEAFVATGKIIRQHLKLKDDIELNDEVKKKFQIDWDYFINNWDDNAIVVAQYKSADAQRTYKGKHNSIDLIEQRVGNHTFVLTDFGKVVWEKVHALLGVLPEDDIKDEPVAEVEEEPVEEESAPEPWPVETTPEVPAEEPKEEEHAEEPVAETAPVVKEEPVKAHMGFEKCSGCIFFDTKFQWCNKRSDYINNLEKADCFEEAEVKLEVAPATEVERICFNCKRWHSGNNPGNLKAIACRCPIHGKKTLTDHTCNKFVAIVRKED